MPSAPNSLATLVSFSVSALVLIFNFLNSPDQFMIVEKYLEILGCTVGTVPSITSPLVPSIVIVSPSFTIVSPDINFLFL